MKRPANKQRAANSLELILKAKGGDKNAIEALVAQNEGLIRKQVFKYLSFSEGMDAEDLTQWGRIGILIALKKFEPERGLAFSTYAVHWIRSRIVRALQYDRLIHIPTHRTMTQAQRDRLHELPAVTNSLDEPAGANRNDGSTGHLTSLGELLAAPNDTEAEALDGQPDEIRAAIDGLPENQREVMILRYGLRDGIRRTLQECGEALGMSREGVRHREDAAILRIRRRLGVKEETE